MEFDELIKRAKSGEVVGGGHEQIKALLQQVRRLERENRALKTYIDDLENAAAERTDLNTN
jgi:uncharacterized protein (UPF0335 family)